MKTRYFLPFFSLLLLSLILSSIIFYIFTVETVISQTLQRSQDAIAVIHNALEKSNQPVQTSVLQTAKLIPAHIIVVDEESRLLADSHKKLPAAGIFINSVISEAGKKSFAYSSVKRLGNDLYVSAARKMVLKSHAVYILVTFQVKDVEGFTFLFFLWLIIMAFVFCLLLWLTVSYFLKQYRHPIRKLLQHTRDFAKSGFYKISVDTADAELSMLVNSFNALTDRYNLLVENDNKKYSRINTLLANLKSGILMVDRHNQIKLVNPLAENLLDIDKRVLFMNEQRALFHNVLIEKILEETRLVNDLKQNRQLTFTRDDGLILDISIEAVCSKYKPYGHSGALVIITDVTELRQLERLKDEFVANVSHELRTPLTVISGFSETLKEWELLENDDRNTAIDIIYLETERLKKLISELLLLSRIDGGMITAEASFFDSSAVICEVMDSLQIKSRNKGLTVSRYLTDEDIPLRGVETWFRQIVYNIYGNAVKFTPDKGSVNIRSRFDKGFFILEISDTGPGISQDNREKIFQRFYQISDSVNRKHTGSGLGLSIARHLVEEFKGTITICDNPGGGSRFLISIPVSEEILL